MGGGAFGQDYDLLGMITNNSNPQEMFNTSFSDKRIEFSTQLQSGIVINSSLLSPMPHVLRLLVGYVACVGGCCKLTSL